MKQKFLTRLVLATVLAGGINLLPVPNINAGNFQISIAYAESKNFAAKEAAMTDVELIETQAKEASRLRAIEAVKEKIASYVRNYSGAKGKLNEEDIAAIAEKYEEVGQPQYTKLFYNAVDESGKELGKVGIMYEATVTAKFNSKKITEYIKLTAQEKERRIRQAREAREKFEELDREYEELRKNARTKTPEQLQSDIKNFDDKLSDLEKSRKNKPVKKDKPTTQQDKNQPMKFSSPVEIGKFGAGEFTRGGCLIDNASYISETPTKKYERDKNRWVYFKGTARFGDGDDALYFHYDMGMNKSPHYKFGSNDINNTLPYENEYGATIFKINANNGHTMYFLRKVYNAPAPYKQYTLIGRRPDGKWVKYFDTELLCKQYLGDSLNASIQNITMNGDTIVANYSRFNYRTGKVEESGEFRFKWDEAAKWFSVEKITYNQKPIEQKPAQENKTVTNQPMQFSQPIKIGRVNVSQVGKGAGGYWFNGADSNEGIKKDYHEYDRQYIYSKGVAKYGNGEDALYIYYDESQGEICNIGGKDIKNTQKVRLFCDVIYKITTNKGITLYPINFIYGAESRYTIIGRQKDGKWVKYIDTSDISKTYFGTNERGYPAQNIEFDLTCKKDILIMQYRHLGRNRNKEGEFRFKWDEKAQWFSVEQVKY